MSENGHPKDELDRFWEIDALLPRHKSVPPAKNTDTTEIVIEPKTQEKIVVHGAGSFSVPTEKRFIPPHTAEEGKNGPSPESEYIPDSLLIHRVRIFPWKSPYRYYEDFAETARKMQKTDGKPCSSVPFFAYVPQYSQMNREQTEWYLWWRKNFREGRALPTDCSYLLLYVFELINLSDILPPKEVQSGLFRVWASYRDRYPQLDSYLPEWICDHALLHRLPAPETTGLLRSELMKHCVLKEFYVPGGQTDGYARCLLAFCSNYNFEKSKFYTEETREIYEKTIPEVLSAVTEPGSETAALFLDCGMTDSKLTRDVYTGAICSYRIKRKIEASYSSFFRSHSLRFLVTDIVKYTENHLRAHLGIRSRMSIYALATPVKEVIDRYFQTHLPPKKTARKSAEEEDRSYEKLYELPQKPLSFSDAAKIELQSWSMTERLVEAFEEPPKSIREPVCSTPDPSPKSGGWEGYRGFLHAVLQGNTAEMKAQAKALGKLPEAVVDEINELAADQIGDILLETDGDEITVIEDYRSTLDWVESKTERN